MVDAYWQISARALDRFVHPRNLGPLPNADGQARVTGPCGDTMEIWLRVERGRIARATFVTDGCGPSLASGSMVTELAEGMSLEEASHLQQNDVLDALGGLPEESTHCAVLAVITLRAAIEGFSSGLGT